MPDRGPTPPPETQDFQTSIPPDPLAVRGALEQVCTALASRVSADLMMRIELAVAEILNNIVEHAFSAGPGDDGQIGLQVFLTPDELMLLIRDNGQPMPGGEPPDPAPPDFDADDVFSLPEGGFGWSLVRELSDRISYAHLDGKNQLEVGFSLSPA